jgi:hypothetical protein
MSESHRHLGVLASTPFVAEPDIEMKFPIIIGIRSRTAACIFCRSEADLTREHVFPAFMGGELEMADGSCSRCNGEFATWEGEIKKETALLLHLLRIENSVWRRTQGQG